MVKRSAKGREGGYYCALVCAEEEEDERTLEVGEEDVGPGTGLYVVERVVEIRKKKVGILLCVWLYSKTEFRITDYINYC